MAPQLRPGRIIRPRKAGGPRGGPLPPEAPIPRAPRFPPPAAVLASAAILLGGCGDDPNPQPGGKGPVPPPAPAAPLDWSLDEMGPLPEEFVPQPGSGSTWISGVVVDGDGRPVPFATVQMHAAPRMEGATVLTLHASAKAGPDGTFRVGPGPSPWSESGVLSAVAPGFARTSLRPSAAVASGGAFADEGKEARLVLRPGITVTGDVRGEDGGPPDGPVTIWAIGARDYSEVLETDAAGAFSFLAPPAQQVMLNVVEGHHPHARTLVETGDGTEVRTSLTVRRGRDIRGLVLDLATLQPVPGAVLRAYYGRNRILRADGEGKFLLPRYWFSAFQVQAPGYAVRQHILASDAGTPRAGPETVRLFPGFSARGKVTDLDGRPLPRVRLRLFLRDRAGGWQDFAGPVSRADGSFTMIGLPLPEPGKDVRVFAVASGFALAATEPLAAVAGGVVEGLVLRAARLVTLEGRVEDEARNPVEAAVSFSWVLRQGLEEYRGKVPSGARSRSGPDGRWTARVPERATIRTEVSGEAFRECTVQGIAPAHPDSVPDLTRPSPEPLVLKVFRGLSIRGTVEDTRGDPVRLGDVHLDPLPPGSPGPTRDVRLRPDGTFEAGGLDPGTYGLSVVVHPEFLQEIRHGLEAGGPPVRVVLRRAGGVNGRVVLPPGAPPDLLAEVTLRALGETTPLPAAHGVRVRASKGAFSLGPLAPGPYALAVSAGDWILDLDRVEVGEKDPTEAGDLLLRPGAAVAGTVLVAGSPRGGVEVEIVRRTGTRAETARRVLTGSDGTFRAGGLRAGPHVLCVRPQDRPRVEVPFEAGESAEARADAAVPLGGLVLVKVLDAAGAPAPGARVLLSGEKGSLLFWKEGSPDPGPHATGKDGTLRCAGVPPGPVRVFAEVPGVGAGEAEATAVEGRAVPVEVRLSPR